MKKVTRLCVLMLLCCIMTSCADKKEERPKMSTELEGMLAYSYYFSDSEMLISNQDRIMYSDWENISFDYICTEPVCDHTKETCTAFAIGNEERREDNSSFVIEYNERLFIFEKYAISEDETIADNKIKTTTKYYTDIFEAELDGSNRKHKLTVEGITQSDIMTAGVIVAGGQVWFGGPKVCVTISEYITDDFGNQRIDSETEYTNAIYSVDLYDYSSVEYAEKDKEDIEMTVQFVFDGVYIYAVSKNYMLNKMYVYRIDQNIEQCQLLFEELGSHFVIGVLGDYILCHDDTQLYYRKLSDIQQKYEFKTPETEVGIVAAVIDGKLALLTSYVEKSGYYETEYTFYNENLKEIEKLTYDDYFIFWTTIGDKIIYVKPFAEQQMWWKETEDLANLLQKATYIGSFTGFEHDKLDE